VADEYLVQIDIKADSTQAIRGVEQVQTKLKGVEGAARQGFGAASRESGMLQGALGGLQSAVIGIGTAFVAQIGIDSVMQLRELGAEADFAYQRFEALAGGPELTAAAMESLREKTGGAVSDMKLQTDAAGLMLTGLADTAGEAGDLIALGLRLGGEEGVEALSRALKNNSIEMLDNLGISAADVRELRDQYTAAGMDSSEAFARATLEIGRETAARLGDAADAGITEWDRMMARANNTLADFGLKVNAIVESLAGAINDAAEFGEAEAEDVGRELEVTRPAIQAREQLTQDLADAINMSPLAEDIGFQVGMSWVEGFFQAMDEMPHLTDPTALLQQSDNAASFFPGTASGDAQVEAAQWLMVERVRRENLQLADVVTSRQQAYAQFQLDQQGVINDLMRRSAERQLIQARMDAAIVGANDPYFELSAMSQGFNYDAPRRGMVGEQMLFSEDDARRAGELVRHLEGIYETAQNSPELVSAESLEAVKNMAEQGREWREYIEAGVEALDNMTVPELFGQGVTNPLLAGLGDDFISTIAGDLTDEERQSIQDQIDLLTGAQTTESLRWRDEGIPVLEEIYRTRGEEDAVNALLAYEEAVRNAKLTGIELPDPMSAFGYVRLASGELEERQAQGWTPAGLDEGDMTSSSQFIGSPLGGMLAEADDLATKINSLATDSLPLLAGAVAPTTAELGLSVETAGGLKSALDGITGQTWKIRLDWEAMNMSNVPPLMREVIAQEVAKVVRANGGTSPGTDPRRNRTSN
jgi:hypothetical protein